MNGRKRYRRRLDRPVVAVRLQLETDGFDYRKWNDRQHCKAGDWIVDNEGDVYTVHATSFDRTYKAVGAGTYVKTTPIWAEKATEAGSVQTKEGRTHYEAGDYIVWNDEDGSDAWAISAEKFDKLYEPDE
jgi:hypothetical protein